MANTIVNGTVFAEMVKDYVEGSGTLLQIAKISDYQAETGTTVKIPKLGFLGEATEVVNGATQFTDTNDVEANVEFKQIQKGVRLTDLQLKGSLIDRNVEARAEQTRDSIVAKLEADLLEALDAEAPTMNVASLSADTVLDAEGLLGQKLTQRQLYIVANGKVASALLRGVKQDKSAKATEVHDATIVRFDAVANDTFYLVQQDVLEVLVGKEIATEVFRESDFAGDKISTSMVEGTYINDESRAVKVVFESADIIGE